MNKQKQDNIKRDTNEPFMSEFSSRITRQSLQDFILAEPLTPEEVDVLSQHFDNGGDNWSVEIARKTLESTDFSILSSGDDKRAFFLSWNGQYNTPQLKFPNGDTLINLHNVAVYGTGLIQGSFVSLFNFDSQGRNAIILFSRE